MYASCLYGVSKFCSLLAKKRNLNSEIAATCGMLHDIGYMADGSSHNHAIEGAKKAETILKAMNAYNDDELLKDADVMDHCFYNNDFEVAEWEVERYHNLLIEFGLNANK
ncbi:HDIG domain-containing metalloprotein [Niameybacter sp.]|uniref:HDIG domain-containing metalloprotein n=1 Tax=Niameybacter sp. TaxID=2033640 RepID=UPI002FCBD868